jgi:hypothetical protein
MKSAAAGDRTVGIARTFASSLARFCAAPWHIVRAAAWLLLAMAACAKAVSANRHGFGLNGFGDSFEIPLLVFEACLVCWLMSGAWVRWAWAASLGTFWTFFIVSARQAVSGGASCGCFGDLEVDPAYVALIDAAMVIALCRWPPLDDSRAKVAARSATVMLSAMFPAATLLLAFGVGGIRLGGQSSAGGGATAEGLNDPAGWVGSRFPLLEKLAIGEKLGAGRWLVVFVRPGCAKCDDVIAASRDRGGRCVVDGRSFPIALVQLPYEADTAPLPADAAALVDALRAGTYEGGLLPAPAALLLDAGGVSRYFDSRSLGRLFSFVR